MSARGGKEYRGQRTEYWGYRVWDMLCGWEYRVPNTEIGQDRTDRVIRSAQIQKDPPKVPWAPPDPHCDWPGETAPEGSAGAFHRHVAAKGKQRCDWPPPWEIPSWVSFYIYSFPGSYRGWKYRAEHRGSEYRQNTEHSVKGVRAIGDTQSIQNTDSKAITDQALSGTHTRLQLCGCLSVLCTVKYSVTRN